MKSIRFILTALPLTLALAAGAPAEDLSGYSGHDLYKRFCSSCHGAQAEGNGPVAGFFKLKPPDLTRLAQRHGGKFPADKVRQIIDGRTNVAPHGAREMPVWGLEFMMAGDGATDAASQSAALITKLVDYLASIQSH